MKVARLYGPDDIRIEDAPVPEPGPHEALLRTKASGICSGDVMPWYIKKKAPLVLGHEPAGEIVEVGEEVASLSVGDRVFVHHHAPCLRCRYCRRGDYVQCGTWRSTKIIPGGIAEYILVPEANLANDTLKLPEAVSCEDGTLIEPLACVVKGLRRAGARAGDTALVMGLGVMGMLNVMALRHRGAGRVIGADMVPFRLQKALELGADSVIDVSREKLVTALKALTAGEMADTVVVGPNSVRALAHGISSAGAGGAVLMFTPVKPGETLTMDPNQMYFKDINLVTSYSCGPDDTKEALKMIEEGVVRASHVVTHRFPIEETERAYRLTAEALESLKCLIVF
jgi:L-iditol 2-dehydrogenase